MPTDGTNGEDRCLDCSGERRRHLLRLAVLGTLAAVAVIVAIRQPVAIADAVAWGEGLADYPTTIALIILIQALLLALALPGTLMLWVVAPFYPPLAAAAILTAGSTVGALGAYLAAGWFGRHWHPGPTGQRALKLLRRQGDFVTQVALRVLPGFPHSVVNYGAGSLRLPLVSFLAAAAIGLGIKWTVYAFAVAALVRPGLDGEGIDPVSLLPLLVLAVLLVGGRYLRSRLG